MLSKLYILCTFKAHHISSVPHCEIFLSYAARIYLSKLCDFLWTIHGRNCLRRMVLKINTFFVNLVGVLSNRMHVMYVSMFAGFGLALMKSSLKTNLSFFCWISYRQYFNMLQHPVQVLLLFVQWLHSFSFRVCITFVLIFLILCVCLIACGIIMLTVTVSFRFLFN